MSQYTSTREGFQCAMKSALTGSPEDAKAYSETLVTPTFYHLLNGGRLSFDDYVKHIAEWRGKVSAFEPTVHEFLRDGDQLAARATGTITAGEDTKKVESFVFAKVDKESGRMEWMIERMAVE